MKDKNLKPELPDKFFLLRIWVGTIIEAHFRTQERANEVLDMFPLKCGVIPRRIRFTDDLGNRFSILNHTVSVMYVMNPFETMPLQVRYGQEFEKLKEKLEGKAPIGIKPY